MFLLNEKKKSLFVLWANGKCIFLFSMDDSLDQIF